MKKNRKLNWQVIFSFFTINLFFVVIIIFLSLNKDVLADTGSTVLFTTQNIQKGIGLILENNGIKRFAAKAEKINPDTTKLSFDTGINSISDGALISGFGLADTTSLLFAQVINPSNLINLPTNECTPPESSNIKMEGQKGLLISLLEIRDSRRKVIREEIKSRLDNGMYEKLASLEKLFGLEQEKKLSSTLSAYELINRLERIKHSLILFKSRGSL
jgi:hypothetical protein